MQWRDQTDTQEPGDPGQFPPCRSHEGTHPEGHGEKGPWLCGLSSKNLHQSDHGTTSNFSRGTFYKIFAQSCPKLHQEQGKPLKKVS